MWGFFWILLSTIWSQFMSTRKVLTFFWETIFLKRKFALGLGRNQNVDRLRLGGNRNSLNSLGLDRKRDF